MNLSLRHFDRQPLYYDIKSLEAFVPHALYLEPPKEIPPPPAPPGGGYARISSPRFSIQDFRFKKATLRWRWRWGHIFLETDLGNWQEVMRQRNLTSDAFRQEIEDFIERAKELLRRKDIRAMTVTIRTGKDEHLTFHVEEKP